MLQIFLDGHEVKIKEGTAVKLVVENPLFSSGDQYTFDIELPLKIKENRDFFGFLGRLDVEKKDVKYDARMMADNRTVITGEAIITQVSESSVKVQLLGHGAAYNYSAKSDERYIDALDLGDYASDTWSEMFPRKCYGAAFWHHPGANLIDSGYFFDFAYGYTEGRNKGWVMFPVMNTDADVLLNGWKILQKETGGDYGIWFRTDTDKEADEAGSCRALSPQPFLWFMAKKIAAATGMTLADEDNILKNDDFLSRIFIANNSGYAQWCKALPHWTVSEWWQELENAFGIIQVCKGDKMALQGRNMFYSEDSHRHDIRMVADEYTVDIDSDEDADISVSNVGFADFDSDPMLLLSEDVRNSARKDYSFANMAEIAQFCNSRDNPEAWRNSVRDVLFCCADGHQYIYWEDYPRETGLTQEGPALVEVNQYRARIADESKDVEVELRFVPCRMVDFVPSVIADPGLLGQSLPIYVEDKDILSSVKILSCPGRSDIKNLLPGEEKHSVILSEIIKGEEDAPEEASEGDDLCYLAIYPDTPWESMNWKVGSKVYSRTYPQPLVVKPNVWYFDGLGSGENHFPKYSFSLNRFPGCDTISSATSTGVEIDTRTRHCISFISQEVPDVSSVFVIHNRTYVCSKIEVNIDAAGLSKLMTGYFYRVKISGE